MPHPTSDSSDSGSSGSRGPFGELLRQYRLEAGLTQEELATRAKIGANTIGSLERGVNKRPHAEIAAALAGALGLDDARRERLMEARRLTYRSTPPALYISLTPSTSWPLTLLVGRARELAGVADWLEGAGPPLLALTGEPGIGKTRLLSDTVERAAQDGWLILRSACYESDRRTPYAPLIGVLAGVLDAISPDERRRLLQGCGWLARLLPEIAESVTLPASSWDLPPEQERRLMFDAAARFLHRLAQPTGALLALDDLQWATPDGLDLLAALLRSPSKPGGRGLRVITTLRDEALYGDAPLAARFAELRHEGLLETAPLGPLDAEDAAALVRLALGSAAPDALLQKIIGRAGGVPLFLLSLAQEAAAQPTIAPDDLPIPTDIVKMVQRRVSQLPLAAADLLAIVAVNDKLTPFWLLIAASDHGERQVIEAIEAASAARLLSESLDDAYRFPYDIYRGAMLATISEARQRALHRRIGVALEADPRGARTASLAHHYGQSDENARALYFLERNGDEALEMRAYSAAEACYRDALTRVGESVDPSVIGRLWDKLGALFMACGKYDDAVTSLESAVAFYQGAGDLDRAGLAVFQIAWAQVKGNKGDLGLPAVRPWLEPEMLSALAPLTRAALWRAHAILAFSQNRHDEQLTSARRATAIARNWGAPAALAQALRLEGLALTMLGWYDDALPVLRETLRLAKTVRDLDSYAAALNDSAAVYRARGDLFSSKDYSSQSVTVADEMGEPTAVAFLTASQGDDCFYLGDWSASRARYEQAQAAAQALGPSWVAPYPLLALGQLNLAEGNDAEGVKMLNDALNYAAHDRQASQSAHIALAGRDLARGAGASALARLQPLLDPGAAERDLIELLPWVGWAMLETGASAGALTTIERGCALAAARGSRLALVDALTCLARAQGRLHDWNAAERSLDDALELARAMAYPYAEARALTAYGELWVARGASAMARVALEQAITICVRLGERLFRDRAERLLATLGGASARRG